MAEIEEGLWWVRNRYGELTVVEVKRIARRLRVEMLGSDTLLDIGDAKDKFEFVTTVARPR